MFRCPVCIAVLVPPEVERCPTCRQRLRRRQPIVLGEQTRIGARVLPIDRALQARRRTAPPAVATATRVDAAPAVAAPAPVAAAAAPPAADPGIQALVDELYRRARAELHAEGPDRPAAADTVDG